MTSQFMHRALALARRGLGHASPNPMVGAVLVDEEGRIVAQGYHAQAGRAHAEAVALKKARERARGTTLYVTLEPCNHTGRTPPCTDAIIRAGIRRVVVAMADPNPHVAGGGIDRLKQAGIRVDLGDGAEEALELNRAFVTWSRAHRPWVTLKVAMSLDGKVASVDGQSKYLTSERALQHAHELRRTHDAILVGSGTILADNPRLTFRGTRRGHDPVRVILDGRGRISPNAQVFRQESTVPTLVFTSEAASSDWERSIFSVGGEVVTVATGSDGRLAVGDILEHLADRHILSLLVEGGPTVHASFIQNGLADQWVSYGAPLILGGQAAPGPVAGQGFPLHVAPRLKIQTIRHLGPDIVVEARFHPGEFTP